MELVVNLAATWWTLIPIGLTVAWVLVSKKIVQSMVLGIVAAALMVANFNVFDTVILLERTVTGILFAPGETALFGVFSRWYLSIIVFLLGLGIVTTFAVITGSAQAFVNSLAQRVKTRRGVQLITVITGIVLMIDDYFNAMVNGGIAKNLGDRHRISRAKFSYIVDSIAAPICIIAPVSSWAVAIMGNMSTTYASIGQAHRNAFMDFIHMIGYNFYVFAAMGLVLVTIGFDFNIFGMTSYEAEVMAGKPDRSIAEGESDLLAGMQSKQGTVWDFWMPIVVLTAATVLTLFFTGFQRATPEAIAADGLVYAILDNWSLSMSLLMGGVTATVAALHVGKKHVNLGEITPQQFNRTLWLGLTSMAQAILILVLSWTIGALIGHLEVGRLVADSLGNAGIYGGFLPLIMFVAAAFLAFSIGTSWGTFALVLPIAGVAAYQIDLNLLLPAMSAVLSGAVWGDHASPISDTTVLAAAGTSCDVVTHFRTQLPYALIAAGIAMVSYLVFGLTGNLFMGYIGFGLSLGGVAALAAVRRRRVNLTH